MRARGTLSWGGDVQGGEPYVFQDPGSPSGLRGFEVEIAGALARRLGVAADFVQNDWQTLIPSLERGRIDGALLDNIIAARYGLPRPTLREAATVGDGVYAIAVRPDQPGLLAAVDGALAAMTADGELRAILGRWDLWDARQETIAAERPGDET